MTKAYAGSLPQFGHAPRLARIAEHHAQHLGGLGFEQRSEFTPIGDGLARDLAFDKNAIEYQARIAFKVEKAYFLLTAQRLSLR